MERKGRAEVTWSEGETGRGGTKLEDECGVPKWLLGTEGEDQGVGVSEVKCPAVCMLAELYVWVSEVWW